MPFQKVFCFEFTVQALTNALVQQGVHALVTIRLNRWKKTKSKPSKTAAVRRAISAGDQGRPKVGTTLSMEMRTTTDFLHFLFPTCDELSVLTPSDDMVWCFCFTSCPELSGILAYEYLTRGCHNLFNSKHAAP